MQPIFSENDHRACSRQATSVPVFFSGPAPRAGPMNMVVAAEPGAPYQGARRLIARASPDGRPFPPPCRSPHCSLHWLPSPPSHTDEVGRCRPNLDREARGVGACVAELAGPDSISLAPSPIVQQARTKSGFADFAHHGWLPA
jgi:hypothetical protein